MGNPNKKISEQLLITVNTVQRHVSNILDKTSSSNRTEAVGFARQHNLL